jgi:hypothetical protein
MGINWLNMAQLSKKVTGLSWRRFTEAHVPAALLAALIGLTTEVAIEGARAAHLGNIPALVVGSLVAAVTIFAVYRLWPTPFFGSHGTWALARGEEFYRRATQRVTLAPGKAAPE